MLICLGLLTVRSLGGSLLELLLGRGVVIVRPRGRSPETEKKVILNDMLMQDEKSIITRIEYRRA